MNGAGETIKGIRRQGVTYDLKNFLLWYQVTSTGAPTFIPTREREKKRVVRERKSRETKTERRERERKSFLF